MKQKEVLFFCLNDDEYITSYITKMALHHWGFKIIETARSEEAIFILNMELPDLIIMDITPELNPYEIKIIKVVKRMNIPIIYLVSNESQYIIELGIMKDCNYGVVSKPIDVKVLNSVIHSLLKLPQITGREVFVENERFHGHPSV